MDNLNTHILQLLKRVEWSATIGGAPYSMGGPEVGSYAICPVCRHFQPGLDSPRRAGMSTPEGHMDKCAMKIAIEGLERLIAEEEAL